MSLETSPSDSALETEQGESQSYDWSASYRKFDAWDEPCQDEENARREKQKKEEERARQPLACNHDHSAERKIWEMPWPKKMESIFDFRTEGNYFFREAQFSRAARSYHMALTYLEYCVPDTDEEEGEYNTSRFKTHLNFSLCMKRLKQRPKALIHVTQALQYEPKNVKALYHLAQLYRLGDDFDLASRTLETLVEVVGQENTFVNRERFILKKSSKAYAKTRRDVSKKMFSFARGGQQGEVEGDGGTATASLAQDQMENELSGAGDWIVGSKRSTKNFVQTTKLIIPSQQPQ
jgi:tetratricopeptide (TPR) repeat protein